MKKLTVSQLFKVFMMTILGTVLTSTVYSMIATAGMIEGSAGIVYAFIPLMFVICFLVSYLWQFD